MADENNKKSEAALREEKVLEFWRENKIFEKSLEKKSPRGEFVFYEGPPGANGRPHIGHLPSRAFKDAIPRYKTMQGYHVRRKSGWDTHGLPVELQVEKQLGLNSKKAIEEYGVEKFNQKCKESVWEYLDVWDLFTKRMGYWLDQEHPYVTYHNDYIESVWNIVKKIDEQNLLYKDYRIVPWCPRCGTALSSHELAQGYQDDKDLSVYAKFKIRGVDNGYFLAWTTTPWTLPGNVALAVGKDITYVEAKVGNEVLVLAKERLPIITEPYEIIAEHKGSEMLGMEYEPLYPYLAEKVGADARMAKAYKVYEADFVNTEDGTGIVHTAVMYGQDDFVLGTKIGLPKFHLVNPDGKFISGLGFLENRFVKDEEVAIDIIKDLAHRGLLFKKEKYEHSYPHCWRCKTALIYYARDSWYIRMSDPEVKAELISENKKINWEPEHIRDGRFGEWLREIKDWAISRERYWGTPLPVWECLKCGKKHTVGGVEELKKKVKKSGNKYYFMRHGQAENNIGEVYHVANDQYFRLTDEGVKRVHENIEEFKGKVDVIISSPYERTVETTKVVCEALNFPTDKVVYDKRIREWEISTEFNNKPRSVMKEYYDKNYVFTPAQKFTDGESFEEAVKRVGDFIYEVDNKYKNKNIFIVSHSGASRALSFVVEGAQFQDLPKRKDITHMMDNAEIRSFSFASLPHNEKYELDLHKPFIDSVELVCDCGGNMARTKEVMDVWFDSGAMPFAEDHYPFENKKLVEGKGYPADYICEGLDQTRGWFYTLHAVGILMGRGRAYKNVICLGLVNDAKGQKMSKSVGNVVDPFEAMDQYGVDTLRMWMFSINQPGESKNFDPKTVSLVHQQVFGLLYNVLAFYELYRDKNLENNSKSNSEPKSKNILDQWILARLSEVVDISTKNLDAYKLLEPTRAIRDFVGDLSTWYLRRSRDRIKEDDKDAKQTLYYVLKTIAKLLAPFAPFTGEDLWLKLKAQNDAESVHLTEWPVIHKKWFSFGKPEVLERMKVVRDIVSVGLQARQKLQQPVRQPLDADRLEIPEGLPGEYIQIIEDELNIKNAKHYRMKAGTGVFKVDFNPQVTQELKLEGNYRELVRALQDMRKKAGLTPSEPVNLEVETNEDGKKLINKFEAGIKKTVLISNLAFKENDGEEVKAGDWVFKVKIFK